MFTHFFDGLFKLLTLGFAVFIVLEIQFLNNSPLALITGVLTISFILYFYVFRSLSSFFYTRFILKMDITYIQASLLNPSLSPLSIYNQEWLKLEEVKDLESSKKLPSALEIQDDWLKEKAWKRKSVLPTFIESSTKTKVLTILSLLWIAYSSVASFTDWPPASFINSFLSKHLEIYSPMATILLLVVPVLLLVRALDKNVKL